MKVSISQLLLLMLFVALLFQYANVFVIWAFVSAGYVEGYFSKDKLDRSKKLIAGTIGGLAVVCTALAFMELALLVNGWQRHREDPTQPIFLDDATELVTNSMFCFAIWGMPCWMGILGSMLLDQNRGN